MRQTGQANHLADETSPYLIQHAHHPVDWHPWCDEALRLARLENKPILLSIGYSACHWCHVMAHESFEDAETAALMNRWFVNIKVDREERPDLDKIYQLAHQLLSRRLGGWPLTAFLHPHDQVPFFIGTYFPKEPHYNLPSFQSLLEKIHDFHQRNRAQLAEENILLLRAMQSFSAVEVGEPPLQADLLAQAEAAIGQNFDTRHGGFGGAPKFPHPSTLDFLLRCQARHTDAENLHRVLFSLRKMAMGGIYDQLGGGFCRYAVDEAWEIPHFEKMLYDNGLLLALYSQAWQVSGDDCFKRIASETGEWVLREMQSPEGGYFSSLDADSEGQEGHFYVFDRAQVRSLLTSEEFALVARHFGLDGKANFEGRWHLRVSSSLEECAADLGLTDDHCLQMLDSARAKLLKARNLRIRPGLDDKILASWNALMIKGMAMAGRILRREDFAESAHRAFAFLRDHLFCESRLQASWKRDKARFPAYLDDHAFLLDAALELLQGRWDKSVLKYAIVLAEQLLEQFEDTENGGFFFTGNDHETLIHRPKPLMDEAMPSGNGVAVLALHRLGHLLGDDRYIAAAERGLRAALPALAKHPQAYASLLNALDEWVSPTQTIVLRGDRHAMAAWQQAALETYAPWRLSLAVPKEETDLPGLLAERPPDADTVAYVCTAQACLPAIRSLHAFRQHLAGVRPT